MKIAILGAGFTGLTAAYRLQKKGYQVTIFEKEERVGGLAAGFKIPGWEWDLDYHYHHLFSSDIFARNLLRENGKEDLLFFKKPETAIYYESAKIQLKIKNELISKFDSPLDLLTFPHLSLIDKVRTGMVIAYLKLNPNWRNFEKVTAYEWLNKYLGTDAFEVLFKPLFIGKFGKEAEKISMAWFWARIYKRSSSLGYIKGGFQAFAQALAEKVVKIGGKINLSTSIRKIEKNNEGIRLSFEKEGRLYSEIYDKVLCTLPTNIFLQLASGLPADYRQKLAEISHLDALNLILILKKPFFPNKTYWLNINNPDFPFLAVVEHTNFIDPVYYDNQRLVYVGNYLPADHPYFTKSREDLLAIFIPYLKQLSPDFDKNLLDYQVFHGSNAQTIVPVNYSKLKPDFITPWKNLYLANLDMVYPWDRGTNYAIELGEKAAKIISI